MKTGYGLWIAILGILGIIIGGVVYAEKHHTIGLSGIVLGVILIIIGVVVMMMKPTATPKPPAPQPAQPAKTP